MTSNQIAYRQAKEAERSNRAREGIQKDELTEKTRSNRANERINKSKVAVEGVGTALKGLSLFANDPSWYNQDPALVRDTASLSYNTPLGVNIKEPNGVKRSIPGILVMNWIPTIGQNGVTNTDNVANIAAKNIYAYVRYANSGARNYESADLMMYLLSVDQLISYHASLTRIYSVVMTSKGHNRYWVNAMLQALGVNADDIRNNIADLRAYINSFAVRLNSFYVPNNLPLFKRHHWMNTTIFKDSKVKKSQDYVFVQRAFGQYIDTDGVISFSHYSDAASIDPVCPYFTPNANITFKQLKALGELLLQRFTSSEDIGIMSGDILKAYGESNMVYTPSIDENFHIESMYSDEVLSQITNASLLGSLLTGSIPTNDASPDYLGPNKIRTAHDIRQTTDGRIYQGGQFDVVANSDIAKENGSITTIIGIASDLGGEVDLNSDIYFNTVKFNEYQLNMYKDDVTPDENMVATRLMIGLQGGISTGSSTSKKSGYMLTDYGTEIMLNGFIIRLDDSVSDNYNVVSSSFDTINFVNSTNPYGTVPGPIRLVSDLYKFDWSPVASFLAVNISEPTEVIFLATTRDNANYAEVHRTTLGNMHYTAVLSEFAVPMLGTKVRTR